MHLDRLQLLDFRNAKSRMVDFTQPTTLIMGKNGAGKTSIVEGIFLLSTGGSFRAGKIEEMIRFGAEIGRVSAVGEFEVVESADSDSDDEDEDSEIQPEKDQLEVLLTRGMVQGKRTQHRLYSVNKVRRRKKDLVGKLLCVAFRPEDMRMVEGSPGRRRTFLNTPLSMLDYQYAHALKTYEQALRRRNKLLEQVREGNTPATTLSYWNMTLVKHGEYIQQQRRNFLRFCQSVPFSIPFRVKYLPSVMSQERIAEYQSKEIAAGHTLIGPHKDDLEVQMPVPGGSKAPGAGSEGDYVTVAAYGSRGQQRLAVLWLKMCEMAYLEEKKEQKALLLLDDILSELDETSRGRVLDLMGERQTVITTVEPEVLKLLQDQFGKKLNLITI